MNEAADAICDGTMTASTADLFARLVARRGHYRLESGLHAATWFELDALLVDPLALAPAIAELAERLHRFRPTAICGPLTGGAFVAQATANAMGLRFFFTRRVVGDPSRAAADGLHAAVYALPDSLRERAADQRFAVVDDVISAGSSVQATIDALAAAGASVDAVGALVVLGDRAVAHFARTGVPLVANVFEPFESWEPARCPMCEAHVPFGRFDDD